MGLSFSRRGLRVTPSNEGCVWKGHKFFLESEQSLVIVLSVKEGSRFLHDTHMSQIF